MFAEKTASVYFLYVASSLCIILSFLFLGLELLKLKRGENYLKDPENFIQVFSCLLTIIFVLPGKADWHIPSWRWQIGAIALLLVWLNFIILLKKLPIWGQNITMLLRVYYKFLKLIYLPVLLILMFTFPFYMLLGYIRSSSEVSCDRIEELR